MSEPWIPRTQKGAYGNGVLWIVGIIVIILAIAAGAFAIRWATAPAKGKLSAREQINSGSFRIAAYDKFFNDCASIQGLEGQLEAQKNQLAKATGDDLERIEANVAGIEGARAQAIAAYNADARKSYTSGQFRSSTLPYQLDTKENTECVVG